MSTYTPVIIRNYVDNLDTIMREAVKNDTLKQVFAEERTTLVGLRFILTINVK